MRVSDLLRVAQLEVEAPRVRTCSKAFLLSVPYLCPHSCFCSEHCSCFSPPSPACSTLDFSFSVNGIIMSQASNLRVILNISLFFTFHVQLISNFVRFALIYTSDPRTSLLHPLCITGAGHVISLQAFYWHSLMASLTHLFPHCTPHPRPIHSPRRY